MGVLEHQTIVEIHAAAMSLGLSKSRDALLAGLPRDVSAGLQGAADQAAQLLVDLDALNGVERLPSGDVPIAIWLTNALALTKSLPQAVVFDRALAALRRTEPASRMPSAAAAHDSRGAELRGGVIVTQNVTGSGNIFSGTGNVTVTK